MPSSAVFLARNLCGICTSMPAPSPARGSAPTAPRCSRLTRIVNASSTILCDLRPLMSAINPTPQESFSSAGSNRPKPDASIVVLAILPEPRPPLASRLPTQSPLRSFRATVRMRQMGRKELAPRGRATLLWRQPLCRLSGRSGCLFLPPGAPSPPTADPALCPLPNRGGARWGHQLGQQCCPIQNMANSATQYKHRPPFLALCARASRRRGSEQARGARSPRFLQTFRASKWIMGRPFAQWEMMASSLRIRATFAAMNFASDNTAGIDPAILDAARRGQPRLCARLRQ